MKITPVKLKKEPDYPTIREYTDHPELLSKNIPLNWLKNKYIATSLAAFILCGTPKDSDNVKAKPAIVYDESQKNKSLDETKSEKRDSVKIAPIFAHGEGFGATGCIVTAPPVFIGEDEAMEIILEAFKDEDIDLNTSELSTMIYKVLPIENYWHKEIEDTSKINARVKIDAFNSKLNLAVYYISSDDYAEFKREYYYKTSVHGYDTKTCAEILNKELKSQSKTNVVVFYDPMVNYGFIEDDHLDYKDAKKQSKKLLLKQVEDFLDWIKDEGILNK
jgi:hypothetical protein